MGLEKEEEGGKTAEALNQVMELVLELRQNAKDKKILQHQTILEII